MPGVVVGSVNVGGKNTMDIVQPDEAVVDSAGARLRPCWRPTMALKPGMVLAKPVSASSGGYATMTLSPGGIIAEETIAQLIVKGIDCVAVVNTNPLSARDYALSLKKYQTRLQQIFGPEPNVHCQALLQAMLARGPMPC